MDGNITLETTILSETDSNPVLETGRAIPVIVTNRTQFQLGKEPHPAWFEPYVQRSDINPIRHRIKRNKKLEECLTLPKVAVSNVRSLLPKINSYKTDILEREIGLSLLTEIWEVQGKKKHMSEVTKMLEKEGLKYISTPRSSPKKRWGLCYCG